MVLWPLSLVLTLIYALDYLSGVYDDSWAKNMKKKGICCVVLCLLFFLPFHHFLHAHAAPDFFLLSFITLICFSLASFRPTFNFHSFFLSLSFHTDFYFFLSLPPSPPFSLPLLSSSPSLLSAR